MFIELTRGIEEVGEKILINVEAIDAVYPFGNGTHIVYRTGNVNVRESYEEVWTVLRCGPWGGPWASEPRPS